MFLKKIKLFSSITKSENANQPRSEKIFILLQLSTQI